MIDMDDESRERLIEAIDNASFTERYAETKAEIIEIYRDKFGVKGWRQPLQRDLANLTGMKLKSIEKRFDPQRRDNPEKRNAAQYKALGRLLPPTKVPRNLRGKRAVVTIGCYVTISNSYGRREFTRTLTVGRTQELLETGGVDAIMEQYGLDPDTIENVDIGSIDIDFI